MMWENSCESKVAEESRSMASFNNENSSELGTEFLWSWEEATQTYLNCHL